MTNTLHGLGKKLKNKIKMSGIILNKGFMIKQFNKKNYTKLIKPRACSLKSSID